MMQKHLLQMTIIDIISRPKLFCQDSKVRFSKNYSIIDFYEKVEFKPVSNDFRQK